MAVCSLDNFSSQATRKVTYFNLSDTVYKMASELHDIKDSLIFKICWTNQVKELSREHSDEDDTQHSEEEETVYTLDLIHSKIFQSCYCEYKNLYDNIKSGELLLEEVDNIFEDYKGKYEDLHKDLDIMCKIDRTDNRKWIKRRVAQIRQYHEHHLVMDSTEIIMNIKNALCPEGDFNILEKLLQMVGFCMSVTRGRFVYKNFLTKYQSQIIFYLNSGVYFKTVNLTLFIYSGEKTKFFT